MGRRSPVAGLGIIEEPATRRQRRAAGPGELEQTSNSTRGGIARRRYCTEAVLHGGASRPVYCVPTSPYTLPYVYYHPKMKFVQGALVASLSTALGELAPKRGAKRRRVLDELEVDIGDPNMSMGDGTDATFLFVEEEENVTGQGVKSGQVGQEGTTQAPEGGRSHRAQTTRRATPRSRGSS
ncbi:hypothetical protein THAOC_02474, partial [Thalassiosira oceanica]